MLKHFQPQYLPYSETGKFSKIVLDYIAQDEKLQPFFLHPPSVEGIKASIEQRKKFDTDRNLLVSVLKDQYAGIETSSEVKKNIELLSSQNTFTICTAHQPNIFTGHLYFIYKILHTIKIATHLQKQLPENNFVPVFYMGSEDADLEELGHIYLNEKKYEWNTKQTGAVGRMFVDDALLTLIEEVTGQLKVLPHGEEIIALLKSCYAKHTTIQQATFLLINHLFQDFGLIVLIPDEGSLKKLMKPVFEDDIFNNGPSKIVAQTSSALGKQYKVQAHPREINLFYLKDDVRKRLVEKQNIYYVEDTPIQFTKAEMLSELELHPERFSPNVILRGMYQETILPNLAFVGGGGELAYWLELKDLFTEYKIPFPVLVVRNSFLLINQKMKSLCDKLGFETADIFKEENLLLTELVNKESTHQLYLSLEKQQVIDIYEEIKKATAQIDITLKDHTEALLKKTLKALNALEKKMLRAEKRKFETSQRQIKKMKANLFPHGGLQERIENFMPYYALYGSSFIKMLYENTLIFQQDFCVLKEND